MGNVSLRKIEGQGPRGGKPGKVKPGILGYMNSGRLPSGRSWKRVQREVGRIRLALIEQYGGADKIQPAVLALIDSAIEGLMIQRLSGLYIKKAGILRADSLAKGNFELHSILSGQFISYANLVRLNLESAARLAAQKPPEGPAPTIAEIIREHDEAAAKAAPGNGNGQGEASPAREASPEDLAEGGLGSAPGGESGVEAEGLATAGPGGPEGSA
jgi:hypothetical protein